MPPDELNDLFSGDPALQRILGSWDGVTDSGEHINYGVSAEDVAAAFERQGRAALSPLVSGQQVPPTPQFLSGSGNPVPAGGTEPTDDGGGQNTPPPVNEPASTPPAAGNLPPESTPPGPPASEPTQPSSQPPDPSQTPTTPPADPSSEIPPSQPFDPRSTPLWQEFEQFRQSMADDPNFLQHLLAYHDRQQTAPAPTTGTGFPAPGSPLPASGISLDDLDLTDPTTALLYNHMQQQSQALAVLLDRVQAHDSYLTTRQQSESTQLVDRARRSFAETKKLTPEELNEVYTAASNAQVMEPILKGYDPETGGYGTPPDTLTAIERALNMAYLVLPKYRERELTRVATERAASDDRKQKLAAVAGSGGSAPRTPNAPRNEQERRAGMLRDVHAMMNGTFTES